MSDDRIVLMDVDGCVNLIERGSPIRSGIALLVDTLVLTGHEVVLWSAGGAEHAEREASRAGFNGSVRRYLTKPDYPMTLEAALAVVGARPVLQIDDDPTERVADWPFAVWHNASDEANALRAELATLKARVEGATLDRAFAAVRREYGYDDTASQILVNRLELALRALEGSEG